MKYKYYFKKPKTEIAKDILVGLALAGAVVMVAAISPSSVALSILQALKKKKNYDKKKSYDVFYRLKRLGFYQLQKSVWVHPYNCEDEIRLLYDFFGFTANELQFIVAEHIDSASALERHFHL